MKFHDNPFLPRSLHQVIDVGNAGEVGTTTTTTPTPEQGGQPAGGADQDLLAILAGLAGGQAEEDQGLTKQDWLGQAFGGQLFSSGAADDFQMSGLGRDDGSSMHEVIRQVGRLNEAELSYLQRRLFQAGFYKGTIYGNAASIEWGTVDGHTADALQAAFAKAANNQVDNFDQFLAAEAVRFRREGITVEGDDIGSALRGEESERSVVDILLEDPDAIKLTAEAVGTELLGRKPTEAELGRITAKIHAEQTRVAKERAAMMDAGRPTGPDFEVESRLLSGEPNVPLDYTPATGVTLTGEQFENARTIITVGQEMGLSEEYIVGALSAAIVESGLRNVNYGDRDSVGLFQQRTSQGWGTIEQIMDPRYSSRKFYEAMLTKKGDTLGEWVANTQRPAKQFRGRYGEQMDTAAGVLQAIMGEPTRTYPVPGQQSGAPARNAQQRDTTPRPSTTPIDRQRSRQLGEAIVRPTVKAPSPAQAIPKQDEEQPFWLDAMVGNSQSDPIYNTVTGVDVNASIAEELKRADPVAYQTRQAALKAYEFFSMLGAGGGLV